jgi:hypothetical protein
MNRVTVAISAAMWIVIVALVYANATAQPASCYAPKNQLHPQIQWDPKTWGRGLA